jgi:2-dehydro-3-deoxyphosphogluconate aldolase/(4S)-4-hydroxy-2-oxoglutarate aldolase
MDASECLAGVRLVPVLVVEDANAAVPLASTLRDAGFGALEVTLRTDAALDVIRRIAAEVPDVRVGAGSVRTPAQVTEAGEAGAAFLVSPGATDALRTAATGIPFVPGAGTASEMLRNLEAGYRLQKFFPAEIQGGAAALRALGAPLPEVRFFPTGGIDAAKLPAYLALPAVACVGGSWFVPGDALARGDWNAIGAAATAAMAITTDG